MAAGMLVGSPIPQMSHHCVAGMRSWVTRADVALIEVDRRPRAASGVDVDVVHDRRNAGKQHPRQHVRWKRIANLLGVVCTDLDALAEQPFAAVLAAVLAATKTKALAARALALAAALAAVLAAALAGDALESLLSRPLPHIHGFESSARVAAAAANTCPASAGATSCGGGGPPDFAGA